MNVKIEVTNEDGGLVWVAFLSQPESEELTSVLSVMAEGLRQADYPYVKTLTANCKNGTSHTGDESLDEFYEDYGNIEFDPREELWGLPDDEDIGC